MSIDFSGVILDLDGLLLDTERLQLEIAPAVLRSLGHELEPSFFNRLVGVPQAENARLIGLELGMEIDAAALDAAWNESLHARMREGIPLRPGVHDFLDALDRHKLPRAVATNGVTARAAWKLEQTGLLERIDAIVGIDQVERGKPAPDVYLEAARLLDLRPSECVALDDSDLGVRAALAADVKIIIQVPDMAPSRDLRAHHQAESLDIARAILGL
ncbi:HAD family hydrolase [Shinella pollutisoli]|uniref:HAD family hydrolase n=1 Tax=Shinella pollutisoli TaxID=2250594 RepID=A0ABV7DEY0_9HYPH|nr:HAD family phosphatase [Shinella pollutisoli]